MFGKVSSLFRASVPVLFRFCPERKRPVNPLTTLISGMKKANPPGKPVIKGMKRAKPNPPGKPVTEGMKEAYPPGKPVINTADLETKLLRLDFGEEQYDEQFLGVVGGLRDRSTEGSDYIGGKKTVQDNPQDPLVMVMVAISEDHTKCLVKKDRFYIYAMTIDRRWLLCNDSPFAIEGGSGFGFDSSYQGKSVNNAAGPNVLMAMVKMNSKEKKAREKAFTSLCLHFAEPCRLTEYETFISNLMLNGIDGEFSPKLQRMRTCWSDLSNCWRDWCLTKTWTLKDAISRDLDIHNAEQLDQALAVLCP